VTVVKGTLNPPTADEIELLEIIAPDDKQARLACCIQGHGDIELEIEYLG
jgi:ferredoxin